MRVSLLHENLSGGLKVVGRAVASRSTLPVLSHVLLSADGQHLELSATDLDIGIVTEVAANVEEPGSITVPARLLADFVGTLPPERIDMVVDAKTQKLNLKCARFEANINGFAAQEFPVLPAINDEDTSFEIAPDVLGRNVKRTIIAASTDVGRIVLTGILFEVDGDTMTTSAADGFRLSTCRTVMETDTGVRLSAIIPARAMSELLRLEAAEPIKVTIGETQAIFEADSTRLVTQLINGRFPDVTQIIPKKCETRAVLDRTELLAQIKALNVFAREVASILQLAIGDGKVALKATTVEYGGGNAEMSADIEGPDLEIAFNAGYLIDVLSVLDADQVALETTTTAAPGIVRAVGDDEFVHMLMPMHIADRGEG